MSNQWTGIIRAAGDPDLRFTPGGSAVASFRGVWSQSRKDDNGEWETVAEMWFDVTAWNEFAEKWVCELVEKGKRYYVTGRLTEREWETQQGEKRKNLNLTLDSIGPVPQRDRSDGGNPRAQQRSQQRQSTPAAEDPWGPPAGGSDEPPF